MAKTTTTTVSEVLDWINSGVIRIDGQAVYKGARELTQRENARNRCEVGDPRVDLAHNLKRKSVNVSHLVWMDATRVLIPKDFEIHHRDENPLNNNFDNLICVHQLDHRKLHGEIEEEVPF